MAAQRRFKTFFLSVAGGVIGNTLFVVAVAATGWWADWENKWWAVALVVSLLLNATLYQWVTAMKRHTDAEKYLFELRTDEMQKTKEDAVSIAGEVESLNARNNTLQEKLNECQSKLVPPTDSEGSRIAYVDMVHCRYDDDQQSKFWTILSLGHSEYANSVSPVRFNQFSLTKSDSKELYSALARIPELTGNNPPADEVTITDDDVPF